MTTTEQVAPELSKPVLRGWIHLGALAIILVAGPLLVSRSRTDGQAVALTIYVASLVALFAVSALFHRVTWQAAGRRRMRRADHSTIFVAIAGSYTAVAVLSLSGWERPVLLAFVWSGALIGIAVRQLWLDAPKPVIAIPYVVVGWSALIVLPELMHSLAGTGSALLIAGGLVYTAGALVYALKRPDPWPKVFGYHEVFHTCTVVGATLQFVVIAAFALPRA